MRGHLDGHNEGIERGQDHMASRKKVLLKIIILGDSGYVGEVFFVLYLIYL